VSLICGPSKNSSVRRRFAVRDFDSGFAPAGQLQELEQQGGSPAAQGGSESGRYSYALSRRHCPGLRCNCRAVNWLCFESRNIGELVVRRRSPSRVPPLAQPAWLGTSRHRYPKCRSRLSPYFPEERRPHKRSEHLAWWETAVRSAFPSLFVRSQQ
jgi:hypothetical protein